MSNEPWSKKRWLPAHSWLDFPPFRPTQLLKGKSSPGGVAWGIPLHTRRLHVHVCIMFQVPWAVCPVTVVNSVMARLYAGTIATTGILCGTHRHCCSQIFQYEFVVQVEFPCKDIFASGCELASISSKMHAVPWGHTKNICTVI